MAIFYNRSESYLSDQSEKHNHDAKKNFKYALYILGTALITCILILFTNITTESKITAVILISIPLSIWGGIKLHKYSQHEAKAKNYKSGLNGESMVLRELKKLSDAYKIYSDGVLGYGNLDFIVQKDEITFFSIEVKNHKGRITSDGKQLLVDGRDFKGGDPIAQTIVNGIQLKQKVDASFNTSIRVFPLLVFSHPSTFVDLEPHAFDNIFTLHNRMLKKFIESHENKSL